MAGELIRTNGEKRSYTSLKLSEINQPQLAQELSWQARARAAVQERLTPDKIGEYADSVLERAKQGDRHACRQLDQWMGVGVPVHVHVEAPREVPQDPLEDLIEQQLLADDTVVSAAVLAARLGVTDADVRRAVRANLDRFVLVGDGKVGLAG